MNSADLDNPLLTSPNAGIHSRMLFDASPIGLVLARMDGRLVDVNPAFASIIGHTVEETLGLTSWQITPDAYTAQERALLQSLRDTGRYGPYEKEYIHRDGHRVPVRLNGLLIQHRGETFIWSSVEDISERAMAESALRENERRLASLTDSLPGMFFRCSKTGPDWQTRFASAGARNITGYAAAEFTTGGRCFLAQVHPEDRDLVEQALETAWQENTRYQIEYRLTDAQGREKWLWEQGRAVHGASEGFEGVEGYITDITDRKNAEAALNRTERAWTEAMNHSGDVLYILDDQRRLLRANKAFYTLTRGDPAALQGRHIADILHPHGEPVPCPVCRAQEEKRDAVIIMEADDPENPAGLPLEITVKILRNTECDGNGILMSLHDLTHDRRLHAALAESEERFRTLVENVPGATYRCAPDSDWSAEFISSEIGNITGYPPGDFMSKNRAYASIIDPRDTQLVERAVFAGIETHTPYSIEYRIRHADGSVRWVYERGQAVYSESGMPSHMDGVIIDITDRKLAEDKILAFNAELEQRVRERTAALEQMVRELETFSYSVSHDLRGPLRAIDGFSHILASDYGDRLDDEARDYLDRIRNAAQRLGILIDDLLELSRVGRARLIITRVDMSALARDVVEQLRHGDPARQVDIEIAPGLLADSDERLLRLVLENLLGNAWKFTEKVAHARIAFDSLASDGETVYRVSDNGAGFDMQYANKLFRPFQRLHHPQEFKGTGIGLATVYRIIARHGGKIRAESAPDEGARFYFTLPAQPLHQPDE